MRYGGCCKCPKYDDRAEEVHNWLKREILGIQLSGKYFIQIDKSRTDCLNFILLFILMTSLALSAVVVRLE